mmetsp:Transcript_21384/g.69012  ORF Transcript_21384/g.69012 Transcript_21384/m.69012 type:complete len:210 (+) Transcript_21384:234-863(+)
MLSRWCRPSLPAPLARWHPPSSSSLPHSAAGRRRPRRQWRRRQRRGRPRRPRRSRWRRQRQGRLSWLAAMRRAGRWCATRQRCRQLWSRRRVAPSPRPRRCRRALHRHGCQIRSRRAYWPSACRSPLWWAAWRCGRACRSPSSLLSCRSWRRRWPCWPSKSSAQKAGTGCLTISQRRRRRARPQPPTSTRRASPHAPTPCVPRARRSPS